MSDIEQSYSGDFVCKYCNTEIDVIETLSPEQIKCKHFQNECKAFLHNLQMNANDRQELQENTKGQSKSALWQNERRKRLTASLFGQVFKAKSYNALENIASRIKENKNISTSATNHGLKHELSALKLYSEKTNTTYFRSGLVIHEKYPFLGASPDALVGYDGVVEIKCPYNIRHCKIENVKLDFLDGNMKLKRTHNYYFQIQGILEVTNRRWCDFVIYTYKDISIERIERDESTFVNMLPSLRDFYYFHLLPKLVRPNNQLTEFDKKWTVTKEISRLPNGLIDDINYYRDLPNKKGYTIAVFTKIPANIKEMIISDYITLNSRQWLSDFSLDILLNLIDDEQEYNIIPSCLSTIIFSQTAFTNHFLQNFNFTKEKLAFPTLINGNHWCLALIDLKRRIFLFLDPLGSTLEKTTFYFNRLKQFINSYNAQTDQDKVLNLNNYRMLVEKHLRQQDGHNCGPYILYFFNNFIKGIPLNAPRCMDSYRYELKKIILQKSDDMTQICLLCGKQAISCNIVCQYCKRSFHLKCINMDKNFNMQYNMCELCRIY